MFYMRICETYYVKERRVARKTDHSEDFSNLTVIANVLIMKIAILFRFYFN